MAVKFELSSKTSASGRYYPTGSEREYNLIFSEPASASTAYQEFQSYVFSSCHEDEWNNPVEDDGVSVDCQDASGLFWKGTVRYHAVQQQQGDTGSSDSYASGDTSSTSSSADFCEKSFSTTGTSARQYIFPYTRTYAANGAPLWEGVEYNEDGVDVVSPSLSIELEKRIPQTALGPMAASIAAATGKVNSKKFQGFAPGTVLFLGCSSGSLQFQERTNTSPAYFYWKVVYQFLVAPHIALPTLGTPIPKGGFEAYWANYEVVNGTIQLVHHVAPVYEYYDFSRLGLI